MFCSMYGYRDQFISVFSLYVLIIEMLWKYKTMDAVAQSAAILVQIDDCGGGRGRFD